jgi:RNA polymerase primary sigma factor
MHERVVRYAATLRRLYAELAREPTEAELALALEVPIKELREIARASRLKPESLDRPINDRLTAGDMAVGDLVADGLVSSPEDVAMTAEVCREVRDVLFELSDRERQVIELRFALADGEVHTLEEIGQQFGLTRERIRQIEAKALLHLRHPIRSQRLAGFR